MTDAGVIADACAVIEAFDNERPSMFVEIR